MPAIDFAQLLREERQRHRAQQLQRPPAGRTDVGAPAPKLTGKSAGPASAMPPGPEGGAGAARGAAHRGATATAAVAAGSGVADGMRAASADAPAGTDDVAALALALPALGGGGGVCATTRLPVRPATIESVGQATPLLEDVRHIKEFITRSEVRATARGAAPTPRVLVAAWSPKRRYSFTHYTHTAHPLHTVQTHT